MPRYGPKKNKNNRRLKLRPQDVLMPDTDDDDDDDDDDYDDEIPPLGAGGAP